MKSIAVIGLGQFGYQIAINLTQKGFNVIAIDNNYDIISEIKDLVSQAVILDSTDEKAMRAIHIDNIDIAVVAIGTNVQSSLLTAALLQRMNINDIYVRAINQLQESILESMGVQSIINIEKDMGLQLSNTLASEVGRYIEISDRHSLLEIKVPEPLVGKSLQQLQVRKTYGINIVGIKTNVPVVADDGEITHSYQMTDVPDPNYPLNKNDLLIIAGTDDKLSKFIRLSEDLSK